MSFWDFRDFLEGHRDPEQKKDRAPTLAEFEKAQEIIAQASPVETELPDWVLEEMARTEAALSGQ